MASERSNLHAEIVRSMLDHESDVINHRITWMATFQGLLFAALGFSWAGARQLVPVFCVLGTLMSCITLVGLFKASLATRILLDWWCENGSKDYDGPPVIGQAFAQKSPIRYLFPIWSFIPLCFIGAWGWIFCINFHCRC
jgi:hypothetical protein